MIRTAIRLLAAAALAAPLVANATLYDFTATLKGSNEVLPNASTATGFGSLQYNDAGTPGILTDDSFFVLLGGTGLTGTPSGWHIHGAATTTQNGPVRVSLDGILGGTALPGSLVSGGLISASTHLSVFSVPATPANGHPAMPLLTMLTAGLAYFNIHTPGPSGFPGGEIRGQLVQVTAVPEPETYAMLAAGLVLVGAIARRRKATA